MLASSRTTDRAGYFIPLPLRKAAGAHCAPMHIKLHNIVKFVMCNPPGVVR